MNGSRLAMLSAIRSSLGEARSEPESEYRGIARDYRIAGTLDPASRLDLLQQRLADYGSAVYRCAEPDLPATIARALAARHIGSILAAPEFPQTWLPSKLECIRDSNLSYEEIDHSEGVLTACTVAIALTGTIVLRHSPGEGRRALTLIPDYHLCVIQAGQVVETVPEAIRRIEPFRTCPLTTISGPSATSDIEMTRIQGVHGPRKLDVILAVP
jgi:L-lactate dehydrogenase complex protein LldG